MGNKRDVKELLRGSRWTCFGGTGRDSVGRFYVRRI